MVLARYPGLLSQGNGDTIMWGALSAGGKNKNTAIAGVCAAVGAIFMAVAAALDLDDSTKIDVTMLGTAIASAILGVVGYFARDADKSSQDSGIRPDNGKRESIVVFELRRQVEELHAQIAELKARKYGD